MEKIESRKFVNWEENSAFFPQFTWTIDKTKLNSTFSTDRTIYLGKVK